MGKRIASEQQAVAVTAVGSRKRKRVCNEQDTKSEQQLRKWEDDESMSLPKTPAPNKQIASLNVSLDDNSPKPVYHLRPSVVNGILLEDIAGKKWRIGKPIGKGNFGEIFLASENLSTPVTSENAAYVAKIEPHSNGPLFVEIHCLLNAGKQNGDNPLPPGMPEYIASGSHYFGDSRYRFLIIKRYDRDLHSLIKNRRITQKSVLILALQILDVLQHLHDKGYCHNDIKAQNLMISKCTYRKSQLIYASTNLNIDDDEVMKKDVKVEGKKAKTSSGSDNSDADSGNSSNEDEFDEPKSEPESNDEDEEEEEEDQVDKKQKDEEIDEDDEDDEEEEQDMYKTPVYKKGRSKPAVQYSGSNPVRSCRRDKRNSIYDEMVKSHYLRPAKRICYSEFFNEDNSKDATDDGESSTAVFGSRQKLRTPARKSHLQMSARKAQLEMSEIKTSRRRRRRRRHFDESSDEDKDDDDDEEKESLKADNDEIITEERVHLIDFGLASKFIDKGVHRPFVMDQRRAHDGTLEFTSRDAHMGAHSRRSDLECLGYNLVYWSQGYLPWRDAASQHQNEKVHWVKEYLMKDVKEMMKHIYGKQVPKYLGEYLQYVGKLAYHERPDYEKCRRIFLREFIALGYKTTDIHLSTDDLIKTSVKVKEEIENNNVIEMKNIKSIMKNLNVIMPFHESTLSNRVSPKNLRSKSAKKKTSRTKFSWTEILSQDPDQIARDRAEKEFDREPIVETPLIRYEGKPTYAILEIQNRLKLKDRIAAYIAEEEHISDDDNVRTVSKACSMKKRQPVVVNHQPTTNTAVTAAVTRLSGVTQLNESGCNKTTAVPSVRSTRTKAGLKAVIGNSTTTTATTTSTKQNAMQLTTNSSNTPLIASKRQRPTRRCLIKTGSTGDFTTSDESSCSSINSNIISINTNQQHHHHHQHQQLQQQRQHHLHHHSHRQHQNAVVKIKELAKQTPMTRVSSRGRRRRKVVNRSDRCSSTDHSSNSNNSSNVNSDNDNDDDDDDDEDDNTSNSSDRHSSLFGVSPTKKKRQTSKRLTSKILQSSAKAVAAAAAIVSPSSPCLGGNEDDVVGARRRKRSIPKKRKSSTKDDEEREMIHDRDLRTFKKRACRG